MEAHFAGTYNEKRGHFVKALTSLAESLSVEFLPPKLDHRELDDK